MSEQPHEPAPDPEPSGPAEVRKIRHLVRLMHRYDLTAIDLTEGDSRIRLRRRGAELASAPANPPPMAYLPAPAPPAHSHASPTAAPASAPPAAAKGLFIESPMVGTYFASSSPEAAPYVSVGTAVRPESTVCVIEAMKVFTDIPAGMAGTVAEILVKNGQAVEFGQPLFRVTPS